MDEELLKRKEKLEKRINLHGMGEGWIKHLPYLEFDKENFQTPYDAGCRMMILYSLAYLTQCPEDNLVLAQWMKKERLWDKLTTKEQSFFHFTELSEEELSDFSWGMEGAYILAWALNLINDLPEPLEPLNEEQLTLFFETVPELGTELDSFLSKLSFRSYEEIIDENLFNELVTTHYRDLFFSTKENTSDIDSAVSFQRHLTLNWLRMFAGNKDWDEIDTAT